MADVTRRWIAPVLVTVLTCVLFPVCGMFLKMFDYTRQSYVHDSESMDNNSSSEHGVE